MINKKDIKIVLNDIDKILNRSGFRFTKQRLIIANEIFSKNPKHFTVQCIFKELIRKNKKVALASVYNTINKFVEIEIIKEIYVDQNKSFFDTITKPHHHIYDKSTGQLSDIPDGSVKISNLPDLPKGKKIQQINIVINIENHSE